MKVAIQKSDDIADTCDDFYSRLDNLYSISPDFYLFDDDEFPRITINSIDGSNGTAGSPWTSKIFSLLSKLNYYFS